MMIRDHQYKSVESQYSERTESFFNDCIQVSSEPVTRSEIIKLGEQLDLRLQESRAKMLGICPVRREIFTQCFGNRTSGVISFNYTLKK